MDQSAYEAILAHVADQAFLADPHGAVLYANAAFVSFWQGRTPGGDAGYLRERCEQAVRERQTVRQHEVWAAPGTGRVEHFETTFAPVFSSESGEITAVAGVCRNVRLEEKLRESEMRFSEAFANAPAGMILMKPTGEFLDANPAYLNMVGYTLEELIGHTSDHFTHPDDVAGTHVYGGSLRARQRESGHLEKRYIRKDGSIFWARAAGTMRYDQSTGKPLMFVAVIEDITQQKQAEEALRRSEDNLRQIFVEAPVAICVLRGPELRFDLCNPCFERLLPGRSLLRHSLAEAVPELRGEVLQRIRQVMETGESIHGAEFEVLLRDGDAADAPMRTFWFTYACKAMRDPSNGNVDGVVIIAEDVTSHVEARRELQRANEELAEFAFVASHDLQEPLRMVNIQAQRLIRGIENKRPAEDLLHFAGEISKAAYRMADLTRDLLSYSRARHDGDESGLAERADLNAALATAAKSLEGALAEADAELSVSSPLPCAVGGSENQYSHVFHNLFSNALKYRREGVPLRITVAVERLTDETVISVRDNGIGFEPVYAERIFGLFKRLHHYGEYPGTGLGLAICKRIVERYNGRIWADATPGEGAVFYFSVCETRELADVTSPGNQPPA